jgi:hypothetical protein
MSVDYPFGTGLAANGMWAQPHEAGTEAHDLPARLQPATTKGTFNPLVKAGKETL